MKRDRATVPEGCWVSRHSLHRTCRHSAPSASRGAESRPPPRSLWGGFRPVLPFCPHHLPVWHPHAPTPSWPRPGIILPPAPRYSRDADLEKVVLDQLLAQHDDAELDAELHQAAARGALQVEGGRVRSHPTPRHGREDRPPGRGARPSWGGLNCVLHKARFTS